MSDRERNLGNESTDRAIELIVLWKKACTGDECSRDSLLEKLEPSIGKAMSSSFKMQKGLSVRHHEFISDLKRSARDSLAGRLCEFDQSQLTIQTWAYIVAREAIRKQIRLQADEHAEVTREQIRRVERALAELYEQGNRHPTVSEVVEHVNTQLLAHDKVTKKPLSKLTRKQVKNAYLSIDHLRGQMYLQLSDSAGHLMPPDKVLELKEHSKIIEEGLKVLTSHTQNLVSMKWWHDLKGKALALRLNDIGPNASAKEVKAAVDKNNKEFRAAMLALADNAIVRRDVLCFWTEHRKQL